MLGLSINKTIGDARSFVEKSKLPSTQLFLPDAMRAQVQEQYESQRIPAKFLINPEGKIITENIESVNLVSTLESNLKGGSRE
jgi:hypothetical protein